MPHFDHMCGRFRLLSVDFQTAPQGYRFSSPANCRGTAFGSLATAATDGVLNHRGFGCPRETEMPRGGPGRPIPPPNQGMADSLEEAKASFAKRYEEVRRGK
jgi:hypothetical protein